MTTPLDAEAYLRVQLDDLRVRNAHHTFEDICVRIARRRISSNILLATGPVSAGGDQSRDAESYYTRVPDEVPGAMGFPSTASTSPVVVACTTTQPQYLEAKFYEDLSAIMTKGEPVAWIAFFCTAPVAIAKQHEWQEHARQTYDVGVDIFDGPKIVTLLAERDLVWIAEQYLQLPAALVPDITDPADARPDWYVNTLTALRQAGGPPSTAGDLSAIRDGLRHATFEPEARADLPEWLRFAQALINENVAADDDDQDEDLTARARYEVVVASLRGLNTLDGMGEHISACLDRAMESQNLTVLENASVLVMYLGGAWLRHIGDADAAALTTYTDKLRSHLSSLLAETASGEYPTRRARLLSIAAHAALHPRWNQVDRPPEGELATPQETSEFVKEFREAGTLPQIEPGETHIDVAAALDRLEELAAVLPDAPGCPVEILCDLFEMLAPLLSTDSRYPLVRDALDAAIAAVEGDSAVADRCRRRALALWRADRPLEALHEFHEAKVKWWHGDTMRGSLLAMRFIAMIYNELHLPHASKQYALTAAHAASASGDPDLEDIIPAAFMQAADAAYVAGHWLDATALTGLARFAHWKLAEHAFDYESHPDLERLDFHQATIVLAAQSYRPSLMPWIEETLTRTSYRDEIFEMADAARGAFARSEHEFVQLTDAQVAGRPFSDTGPDREIRFAALGNRWRVSVQNQQDAVLAAERFAAGAQIMLAELALRDPVLLDEQVDVKVSMDTPLDGNRVKFHPNNGGITCTVFLSRFESGKDTDCFDLEVLAAVVSMLHQLSVLPQDELMAHVESSFAGGLRHKLSSGRPYDEVSDVFGDDHYMVLASFGAQRLVGQDETFVTPSEPLAAPTTPGPGYDRDRSIARIAERYKYLPSLLSLTLPAVLADATVRTELDALRADGWLDWQLLLAIHNIATGVRMTDAGVDLAVPDPDLMMEYAKRPEDADSPPIPVSVFSAEAFDFQLKIGLAVVAQRFGLESRRRTPNFVGLRELLSRRYGYAHDDTEHADLLGGPST